MTLLNSNYEDWRKANPTASSDDFKFSCKKLNPAGALFDYAKLCDVSKNEIARLDAAEVYDLALEYAKEFDPDFAAALESDPEYARSILAIGRGGKKPRKDLTTWKDVRPYMAFFYDGLFTPGEFPAQFDGAVVRGILEKFLQTYDPADDAAVWFDKVKALTAEAGFCADMKAYKAILRHGRLRGRRFDVPAHCRDRQGRIPRTSTPSCSCSAANARPPASAPRWTACEHGATYARSRGLSPPRSL